MDMRGFINDLTGELFLTLFGREPQNVMSEEVERKIRSAIQLSITAAFFGGMEETRRSLINNAARADTGKRD